MYISQFLIGVEKQYYYVISIQSVILGLWGSERQNLFFTKFYTVIVQQQAYSLQNRQIWV